RVVVDPSNPSIAYAYVTNSAIGNPGGAFLIQATLLKTTDGGATWNPILNGPAFEQEPALVLDSVSSQRLLVGSIFPNFPVLVESLDGGASFRSLAQNLPFAYNVNDIALGAYQGTFVQDPTF